jgi:hypothetical protein
MRSSDVILGKVSCGICLTVTSDDAPLQELVESFGPGQACGPGDMSNRMCVKCASIDARTVVSLPGGLTILDAVVLGEYPLILHGQTCYCKGEKQTILKIV